MDNNYKDLIGKQYSTKEIYNLIPNKWVCLINCVNKDDTTIGIVKTISDNKISIDYNEIDPASDHRIIKTHSENIPDYINLLNKEYTCVGLKECLKSKDIEDTGVWVIFSDYNNVNESQLYTPELKGIVRAITRDMPTMYDMNFFKSLYGKVIMQYISNNPTSHR